MRESFGGAPPTDLQQTNIRRELLITHGATRKRRVYVSSRRSPFIYDGTNTDARRGRSLVRGPVYSYISPGRSVRQRFLINRCYYYSGVPARAPLNGSLNFSLSGHR